MAVTPTTVTVQVRYQKWRVSIMRLFIRLRFLRLAVWAANGLRVDAKVGNRPWHTAGRMVVERVDE